MGQISNGTKAREDMRVNQKWSIQPKNNIAGMGDVILPTIDAIGKSVFYVSDGHGSYYSSMRLRKLPIETGEELASVLTRDAARCIYFEKEYIYAFLNKRVLKLDRNNVCD